MPCAAPCNRLPCNKRCQSTLSCGHRCPGICGESCPEGYCQACGEKPEGRVDLLEFKCYGEIDLDKTPIVVLGCGHFFTAESLDGLVGMSEVYTSDHKGDFIGLKSSSRILPVPRCPDCKRPIRQFATQRYNRAINMAVMDEISKKFVVKGLAELADLEHRIDELESSFQSSREAHNRLIDAFLGLEETKDHRIECRRLERRITKFCEETRAEQQPSKRLFDAILHARNEQPLDSRLADLSLSDLTAPALNKQVILSGRLARLKVQNIMLQDMFVSHSELSELCENAFSPSIIKKSKLFLKDCKALIVDSSTHALPRIAIQGSLAYAQITKYLQRSKAYRESSPEGVREYVETARKLLDDAENMCRVGFDGAEQVLKDIQDAQRLLGREWYQAVTAEEIAAIKIAMVSGSSGIATHSGHWYKCLNGHTVCRCLSVVSIAKPRLELTFPVRNWRMRHANGTCALS